MGIAAIVIPAAQIKKLAEDIKLNSLWLVGNKVRDDEEATFLAEQTPGIPLLGTIAAGRPIEAILQPEYLQVPDELLGRYPCYVLRVSGDSMIEEGILDGDYVVIEQCDSARNGEIVVALINNEEATLKRIEQHPEQVILHPANASMEPMAYSPDAVQVQGVLRGLLRRYR